jgi:hypothetical protein
VSRSKGRQKVTNSLPDIFGSDNRKAYLEQSLVRLKRYMAFERQN